MPKPTLLLYDPLSSPWAPKLRQHCAIQGLRFLPVGEDRLGATLDQLSRGAAPQAPAAPLPEPMILLCHFTSPQLDRMLQTLRRLEVPRTCLKAVLTPTNAAWTLPALYEELVKERQELS